MDKTQKTMAFTRLSSFAIVVHGSHPPADEEWQAYLELASTFGLEQGIKAGFLVISNGGAPTSGQRRMMAERLAPILKRFPNVFSIAIVTPSTFVRGIVKALSVVNPYPLRSFAENELELACDYLGIPRRLFPEVVQIVSALKSELTM